MARPDCTNLPQRASKDTFETTHIKMLKWIMGVHKKTNNNFCYGDTGRLPWSISVIPQCIRYFDRVSQSLPGHDSVNTLIHHAFEEQKSLGLSWYNTWNRIRSQCDGPPGSIRDFYSNLFTTQWRTSLNKQSKMSFYSKVKSTFGEEPYLAMKSRSFRTHIAKLRSSSHDLMIEKGRYGPSPHNLSRKVCRFCCKNDGTMTNFECLPFCENPIVESEEHVLNECPTYYHLRVALSDNLKSLLMLKEYGLIMSSQHMSEFGKYLADCHRIRNPETKDHKNLKDLKEPHK